VKQAIDNPMYGLRLIVAVFALLVMQVMSAAAEEKLRVLVETDIGGDADDQASLVRFLLYSNEWDVEGIIADRDAATFDRDPVRNHLGLKARNGWELAHQYLKAFGKVRGHLSQHKPDYPTHELLGSRTVPGTNDSDAGVKLIIAAADRDDARPIWYGNWGSNSGTLSNLQRAFDLVKSQRSHSEYQAFVRKFRIVTLDGDGPTKQGHDDQIVLHVETGYPTMDGGRWYHRFRPLTQKAGGFNVEHDVKTGHGALGTLYTTPKEGDSWTFVYLIPTGLSDPAQPMWGGWAGRYGPRGDDPRNKRGPQRAQFYWANQRDTWQDVTSRDNTVRRFAAHLQNDFKARLDWCVAKRFEDANHEPVAHCQGDATRNVLFVEAAVGKPLKLTAAGTTDPDGDRRAYRWFAYAEPGTYQGDVSIENATARDATLRVPGNSGGKTIHVILEVTDSGAPPLTRYRRIVVTGK
jgi:hypothetical protein